MSLLEIIIHLVLWPFNVAVYTYNALALATGSEPPINFVLAIGAIVLFLGCALALRRQVAG